MPIFLLRFAAVAVRIGAGLARFGARASLGGDNNRHRRGGETPRVRAPQIKTSVHVSWNDGTFLRKLDDAARRALEEAARSLVQRAQAWAPVRTGRLRASIAAGTPYRTSKGWAVDIVAQAPYSYFVEKGTSDTRPQRFLSTRGARGEIVEGLARRL